jgi:hypothetical protein
VTLRISLHSVILPSSNLSSPMTAVTTVARPLKRHHAVTLGWIPSIWGPPVVGTPNATNEVISPLTNETEVGSRQPPGTLTRREGRVIDQHIAPISTLGLTVRRQCCKRAEILSENLVLTRIFFSRRVSTVLGTSRRCSIMLGRLDFSMYRSAPKTASLLPRAPCIIKCNLYSLRPVSSSDARGP